jgi:hypothetical protein
VRRKRGMSKAKQAVREASKVCAHSTMINEKFVADQVLLLSCLKRHWQNRLLLHHMRAMLDQRSKAIQLHSSMVMQSSQEYCIKPAASTELYRLK